MNTEVFQSVLLSSDVLITAGALASAVPAGALVSNAATLGCPSPKLQCRRPVLLCAGGLVYLDPLNTTCQAACLQTRASTVPVPHR